MKMCFFLVYRCNFFTETGSRCRVRLAREIFACWAIIAAFGGSSQSAKAQIDLPTPPKAVPPPRVPESRNPVNIRHEEHLKKQETQREEEKSEVEQKTEKKRVEQAKQEKLEPRPMYGFVELSLLYPKFTTSGQRKKYNGDATTHINMWSRLSYSKPSGVVQPWIGLRIAPFSGSGVQKNYAGRFALTYFGPGIGFGSVDDRPASAGEAESESRYGWLLSAGVAAVSKLTNTDQAIDSGATDFTPSAWYMDSPGAWAEFRWMSIFQNALSWDVIGGAQLGEGKNIVYFGLGISGWL